jgi:hypothetical protein
MVLVASAIWLVAWGFVATSIVVATTSSAPATPIDVAVQGVGRFYLQSVETLRAFAAATTLPARWVDIGYAVLAALPIVIHFFILAVALMSYTEDDAAFEIVFYTGAAVLLIGVIGAGILQLGAQLLILAVLGVGVSLLPLGYTYLYFRL